MEVKKQLEEERERLQKRVQELEELINGEKEILMKKNVPVEQMLKYLGYEKLTREMLEEYVQGIYVYDDGRVEVAERAGISRTNISRFESGEYNPTLEMLVKLATAMDLDILVTLKPKNNNDTECDNDVTSPPPTL